MHATRFYKLLYNGGRLKHPKLILKILVNAQQVAVETKKDGDEHALRRRLFLLYIPKFNSKLPFFAAVPPFLHTAYPHPECDGTTNLQRRLAGRFRKE